MSIRQDPSICIKCPRSCLKAEINVCTRAFSMSCMKSIECCKCNTRTVAIGRRSFTTPGNVQVLPRRCYGMDTASVVKFYFHFHMRAAWGSLHMCICKRPVHHYAGPRDKKKKRCRRFIGNSCPLEIIENLYNECLPQGMTMSKHELRSHSCFRMSV